MFKPESSSGLEAIDIDKSGDIASWHYSRRFRQGLTDSGLELQLELRDWLSKIFCFETSDVQFELGRTRHC